MPRTRNPNPVEFREQLVAPAKAGRSFESLARRISSIQAAEKGHDRHSTCLRNHSAAIIWSLR